MRWFKRAAWGLGGLILVLVVAVGGGIAWLNSGAGRAWLEATANGTLAGTAQVAGLGGELPFHFGASRIDLVDEGGVWARLADVHLDIAPWDLLRGRLTIERLSAATVEVLRARETTQPSTGSGITLPPPLSVDLQQLTLGSVRLPAAVFGEPTTWTADASASLIGHDVALTLRVSELDPSPVRLDARFELSDRRANAHATVEDPRGLLLRRATGESLPLHVVLTDDDGAVQKPTNWHGRLAAQIGDRGRLQATLHLGSLSGARVFGTDGDFDGASLLPERLAALAQPTLRFHLAARDVPGVGWSVDGLMLHSDAVDAEGTGTYRSRGNLVDASLRLILPDLARFSAFAGDTAAGRADMVLAAKGPLDALHAELDAHAAGVRYGSETVDDAAARIAAVTSSAGYDVNGEGTLVGIRSQGTPLPAGLGEAMTWRMAATSDPALETVRLTRLALSSGPLELTGGGSFDRRSQDVAGTLRLGVNDLHGLAGPMPGLRGRGEITATFDGRPPGRAQVRVEGGLDDLATGIPAADALTGGQLRLDARLRRDDVGTVRLDDAALRGAAFRLSANGVLDAATHEVQGDFAAALDDLAVLRQAGLPAAGRLDLSGRVGGTLSAPAVDAHVHGAQLAWQTARVDDATLDLRATAGQAPTARLNGEVRARDVTVGIEADAGLSPDRKTLTVPRLRIASGPDVIAAQLRTALDTLLTSGTVTADLPDLRRFSRPAGVQLGGRVGLKLRLSPREGQTADLAFTADNVSAARAGIAPVRAHHVAANGSLAGLLRQPTGRLQLTGDGLEAAGAELRTIRVSARAQHPERVEFTGDVEGDFKGPFALTATGTVARARGLTRLSLARLNGRVAGTPVRLRRPLLVTAQGPVVAMTDLGLAIGDGIIQGRARRDGSTLDVSLEAARLPVALAGHFAGRDDLTGTVDARIAISGPATQPQGQVELSGRNLRAGPVRANGPALSFSADARLAPRRVDVTGKVETAGTQLLTVSGRVPVVYGPAPGMASLARDGALDVKLRGAVELTRLAAFLPVSAARIAGHVQAAFAVTGTPARPQVGGELSLERGHYEDLETGLIVDSLALDIGADGNRIVLRRLAATDGGQGRLSGSGSVSLGQGPPSTLTVGLTKFQALRRPDASLTASGSATIAGTLRAPVLVARLAVDRAEFFLANPPPPGAKKIPVTVINSATGEVLQQPQPAAASSGPGAIGLDVAVHIPGNTFVRGRGLDSEWRGDVQAHGSSAAPVLTGSLNVVKGTFSFFGKDMTLTRGTVTFTGGQKIAPLIDVLAETTTSDGTFDIGASGTPDDLKLELSSTPAMPQDEILSRLIFGRDVTRLSPAEGLQLAQAAATLSSGGPGILDRVRQRLGLDVLNIGSMNDQNSLEPVPPQGSSSSPTSNTGISAGRYVAKGVYLGAEQGLNGETRSKVEVQVLPHVRVLSEAGTRSEQFGVNWQMDY